MEFKAYVGKDRAFKQTVTLAAFAQAIKVAQKTDSVHFSPVLGTEEKKYCIVTLGNGLTCTLPVSKKATLKADVPEYAAESNDGTWVLCTSPHTSGGRTF